MSAFTSNFASLRELTNPAVMILANKCRAIKHERFSEKIETISEIFVVFGAPFFFDFGAIAGYDALASRLWPENEQVFRGIKPCASERFNRRLSMREGRMSTTSYLTQSQLPDGEYRSLTRIINTAFLLEIKEGHVDFHILFQRAMNAIRSHPVHRIREFAHILGRLRDELETYFSLEEFYGEFDLAFRADPSQARMIAQLKHEHEQLFTCLNNLVERAEQILYREVPHARMRGLVEDFLAFARDFQRHEERELEFISLQSSLDVGVGD
jgi:hypothetical protein